MNPDYPRNPHIPFVSNFRDIRKWRDACIGYALKHKIAWNFSHIISGHFECRDAEGYRIGDWSDGCGWVKR